jgi:hypothetical protein
MPVGELGVVCADLVVEAKPERIGLFDEEEEKGYPRSNHRIL